MPKDYAKKYSSARSAPPKQRKILRWVVLAILMIAILSIWVIYKKKSRSAPLPTSAEIVMVKAEPAAPSQPTFDFYSILTGESTLPTASAPSGNSLNTATSTPAFILQVAAFSHAGDAEHFQKKLTALGFKAFIVTFQKEGASWERVNLGPYSSLDAAKKDQARLKGEHISSLLINQ